MPKPTLFNKTNMVKRPGNFKQIDFIRQQEIGSSVKKYNNEEFKYVSGKNKSFAYSHIPQRAEQRPLFTPLGWDEHLLTVEEIESLVWDRPMPKINPIAQKLIKEKVLNNRQEWIDDMYLVQHGIVSVNFISKKYGFDKYCANGDKGKTYYNYFVKRYFNISGERINFMSRNLRLKGVEHTNGKSGNMLNTIDMKIHDKQIEFVKKLPNRSVQRDIYQPSKWVEEFVQIVDGMKPSFMKKDENGQPIKSKDKTKYILYNMGGLKQQVAQLLQYKQFIPYENRVQEILDNFTTKSVNQ